MTNAHNEARRAKTRKVKADENVIEIRRAENVEVRAATEQVAGRQEPNVLNDKNAPNAIAVAVSPNLANSVTVTNIRHLKVKRRSPLRNITAILICL